MRRPWCPWVLTAVGAVAIAYPTLGLGTPGDTAAESRASDKAPRVARPESSKGVAEASGVGRFATPFADSGRATRLVDHATPDNADSIGLGPMPALFALLADPAGAVLGTVHDDPARRRRIRAAHMPRLDRPVLFDTPQADAVCAALEVFPPDNPWNLVVEDWPLHPDSRNIIASIGPGKPLRYNPDMGFVLVPPSQKKVAVKIVSYSDESDPGLFPVPDNTPIEGWPAAYRDTPAHRRLTLEDGDRHAIVVDPLNRMLYEFYQMRRTDAGWQAAQSSVFSLRSNKPRPDGWTSTDAAGLPIFPAVVRYDELKRGRVEHALRVTVVHTRKAHVYPATHDASRLTGRDLPRMGERIRLRKDFDVTGFSPEVRTILAALKKYGMFVADNGIDWAVSVAPDPRIPSLHEELRKVKGSAFEVVVPPPGYRPPAK